jgi:hypothetical protein
MNARHGRCDAERWRRTSSMRLRPDTDPRADDASGPPDRSTGTC